MYTNIIRNLSKLQDLYMVYLRAFLDMSVFEITGVNYICIFLKVLTIPMRYNVVP